ncbi:MAG: nucleotidyl transferase AbiEii/AbiGii toxin family protein [Acidimicrobiia bacterium]
MIPRAAITAWGTTVPWPTVEQIEQDLLLSRLIVEIANDDYLGNELVFRGGTCMHKLHAPEPLRYSEDLDYVRSTSGGIRELTGAVTQIGKRLGMEVRTRLTEHPKMFLRAHYETGTGPMRIKIEVNTFERSPARPPVKIPFQVDSSWFTGGAEVLTFMLDEVIATKIRALFQRSKGRDLFDLWLALTRLGVPASSIVEAFGPYRPHGYTRRRAELNLREKVKRAAFREDIRPLVRAWPAGYDIDAAAELIVADILALVE